MTTTIGLDIGGTCVKVVGMRAGEVVWSGRSSGYARPEREELVGVIAEAVGGRGGGVERVGVCVPGIYDRGLGQVKVSVNVPGIVGVSLRELVGLGELAVFTDAYAAAVDVWTKRKATGRLLVIALGTGVGLAVLDDGVPLRVEGETPGHLGQVDVSIEGEAVVGPDGGAGGLEGYVGVAALRARYGSVEKALTEMNADHAPMKALARAIRICHAIYCPDEVVLVGGVGIGLGRLVGELEERVRQNLTSLARAGWKLSVGEDAFHAARGAARLAAGMVPHSGH